MDVGIGERPQSTEETSHSGLPVEVEIYINPDGSVTFADLAADMVSVAAKLNPDWPQPGVPGSADDRALDSEETK